MKSTWALVPGVTQNVDRRWPQGHLSGRYWKFSHSRFGSACLMQPSHIAVYHHGQLALEEVLQACVLWDLTVTRVAERNPGALQVKRGQAPALADRWGIFVLNSRKSLLQLSDSALQLRQELRILPCS